MVIYNQWSFIFVFEIHVLNTKIRRSPRNWAYVLLFLGLIQKLRTKEREREQQRRLLRPRGRELRRSLSFDAPPFYPSSDSAGSGSAGGGGLGGTEGGASSSQPTPSSSGGGVGGSSGQQTSDTPVTLQRRQLGERMYPKVAALQPVRLGICILFSSILHYWNY